MIQDAKNALLALGLGLIIIMAVAYLMYMVGLILVLKRIHRLSWMAFVPLLNYYATIRALNAPPRWFLLSLPPYIGAVYAAAVALRLGNIFGRGPAFSLTWLTIGAPFGMFMIAKGKTEPNFKILDEPAVLVDLKKLKKKKPAAPDQANL